MRNLDKPQCQINVLNAEISFSKAKILSLLIPLGLWQIGNTQINNKFNKTTGVEICVHGTLAYKSPSPNLQPGV